MSYLIHSPMVKGSGAIAVHRELERHIPGYRVRPYSPLLEYFPPAFASLRSRHAQVVHSTPDQGDWPVRAEQGFVITFHNFVLDAGMRPYSSFAQRLHYRTDLTWLTRRALARADAITAVSHFTARLVEEYFDLARPVVVIENGIDVERFQPASVIARERIRVLVCGNASRRKGTHWLQEVAGQLPDNIELSCTLTSAQLLEWGITARNVKALGRFDSSRIANVYRDHDILFMPTAREGFGLAVAEAMACGLPVIASDNSTMPELIADGEGGLLCRTGDIEAYATAIRCLAESASLRRKMGGFNRKRALERFRLDRMVSEYDRLFHSLT